MSYSFRAFVILVIIGLSYYLLHPTIVYYFFYPEEIRKISEIDVRFRGDGNYTQEQLKQAEAADKYRENAVKLGLDLRGGINILLEADFPKLAELTGRDADSFSNEEKREAIDRVIRQIENRIDTAGVSEIVIRKKGLNRLVIQLPGETSSKRIEDIVSTTGNLEFLLVNDRATSLLDYDRESGEVLNEDNFKDDYYIYFEYRKNDLGQNEKFAPYALEKFVLMNGERIANASFAYGQYGEPVVAFSLDTAGAPLFAAITSTNINNRIAIVLDGRVISAPAVRQPITGGEGQISGSYTADEANDLALILKSGSLPVPIQIISKNVIAPKIGEDLRDRGLRALLIGFILVIIFMLVRYRLAGLIASFALILNAVIVIAFLTSFNLTISLSGLAGILLTIGMSIDANVIIYERIREEVKNNNFLSDSIRKGYQKAFWTIFDSNVTTMISTFVLFYYGEGIIQGFATTLFIGVIISMFTALFLTRFIFDSLIEIKVIKGQNRGLVI